jgi:hypothetical protein
MIDVNKICSMKTLEVVKKLLTDFLAFDKATILKVYEDEYGWGEEDYEADRDSVTYLLEQVERRMKSLGKHLAKGKTDKSASQSAVPESQAS